jgi:hypothetical protein
MRFISTDIDVFDCTVDWQEKRQLVTAPERAAFAVVYGTSHSDIAVAVTKISFR